MHISLLQEKKKKKEKKGEKSLRTWMELYEDIKSTEWLKKYFKKSGEDEVHTPVLAFRHPCSRLPELVMPLKGHSSSPRDSCPLTLKSSSEKFGTNKIESNVART